MEMETTNKQEAIENTNKPEAIENTNIRETDDLNIFENVFLRHMSDN